VDRHFEESATAVKSNRDCPMRWLIPPGEAGGHVSFDAAGYWDLHHGQLEYENVYSVTEDAMLRMRLVNLVRAWRRIILVLSRSRQRDCATPGWNSRLETRATLAWMQLLTPRLSSIPCCLTAIRITALCCGLCTWEWSSSKGASRSSGAPRSPNRSGVATGCHRGVVDLRG
jgi:hypothetical protein